MLGNARFRLVIFFVGFASVPGVLIVLVARCACVSLTSGGFLAAGETLILALARGVLVFETGTAFFFVELLGVVTLALGEPLAFFGMAGCRAEARRAVTCAGSAFREVVGGCVAFGDGLAVLGDSPLRVVDSGAGGGGVFSPLDRCGEGGGVVIGMSCWRGAHSAS